MENNYRLPKIASEFKYSLKLALPLIASEIVLASSGFIATIMVASLGKAQLAANILAWSFYLAVVLFFIGILCAISIMVSQSFGAKDERGISICFKQGLILSIIFSIPMMLCMWFAPNILIWIKQDPKVILHATPLFHSLTWAMLPLTLMATIHQFLIGVTKTKIVMVMSFILVPIEIFFFYILLFGKLSFPKMELAGIGIGLAVSHSIIVILSIAYLHFEKSLKKYDLFKNWWVINRKFLLELLRVGFPQGLMWSSELVFFAIVAIMMGTLGVATLAAYQIAHQYLMIALVSLFALSHNTAIRVGFEVGRNNPRTLKLTTQVNMAMSFVIISFFSFFYMLFPETAISLDIDIHSKQFRDVGALAIKFFPILGILIIVDCVRLITNGALRGLKDTNFQLAISIFGFWLIAFPTAYFFAFKLGFNSVGIWWGIIIGFFVTGIALLLRFSKLLKTIELSSLVTKE